MSFLSKVFRYVNELGESIAFTYADGFIINKPEGIDTLEVALNQAQGINQVGATVQARNIQPRPVTVNGLLVGEWQAANKDRLLSVIRPDLTGRLYADDYYLAVSPTATPSIGPEPQFAHFQFSVLAPYPYWQQDEEASAVLFGVDYGFRLWDGDESHTAPDGTPGIWNISGEYFFGQPQSVQFINIPNRGQVPVPFILTIYAQDEVENPKITNIETGKVLLLNHTLTAGERVVIEITHDKTFVTSSVHGDIRGALSLSSTLFLLDVGDNLLKPEAGSGGSQMEVTINYAAEVVGISL